MALWCIFGLAALLLELLIHPEHYRGAWYEEADTFELWVEAAKLTLFSMAAGPLFWVMFL